MSMHWGLGQPSAQGKGLGCGEEQHAMQEDSPSLAAGWELGQCSCPTSGLPLGIPCRDPQTPAGSLPTGTRRLLIHPHHPFHSKGRIQGQRWIQGGGPFLQLRAGSKAGLHTDSTWAHHCPAPGSTVVLGAKKQHVGQNTGLIGGPPLLHHCNIGCSGHQSPLRRARSNT